jgi:uncharacterized protein (TIGR03067 family)
MRFCLLLGGLLAIGSLFASNAQSNDLEALQGTWRLVGGEIGGRKMTAEELTQGKLVFKGDRYTVRRGSGPTVTGIVELDSAKNPKTIDITDADGLYKEKTLLGIYAVKGDELKECFAPPGEARPAKFATKPGTSQFLHVLKQGKAKTEVI